MHVCYKNDMLEIEQIEGSGIEHMIQVRSRHGGLNSFLNSHPPSTHLTHIHCITSLALSLSCAEYFQVEQVD